MLPFLAALCLQAPAESPSDPAWTQAELEAVSETIRAQIEELRGMKFRSPVAVRLTDKPGFLDYAKKRMEATESPEKLRRDEMVAKLLGFLPPTYDLQAEMLALLEDQVGGFYDPGSSTFYLMNTFTGPVAKVILAHELTHALDDQHFDLDAQIRAVGDDTDALLALQAVVEGSGTGLMYQWVRAHPREVSISDLTAAQSYGAEALADAPPYLWKPLLAAYLRGDGFLSRVASTNLFMKAAKTEDVVRAFAAPPRSMEQILHPKKYWDPKLADEPMEVSIDTSALPEGWKLAGMDTLGELYLGMLTTPRAARQGLDAGSAASVVSLAYTNEAAEGWGGDRLALLVRGDDALLQLVTAWDSPEDADEFAAALGDPTANGLIPTFAGGDRTRANGWVEGVTPTEVLVSRAASSEGDISLVVVSVTSFATSASPEERARLRLPFRVARASDAAAAK